MSPKEKTELIEWLAREYLRFHRDENTRKTIMAFLAEVTRMTKEIF